MTRERSLLAVRADSLGDVLVTGPAIRALATGANVTMLVSRQGSPAASVLPGVNQVMVYDLPWIVADPAPFDAAVINGLVEDIQRLAPDEAVIFTSFHQSPLPLALVLRLAGIPRISAISTDYAGTLLDVRHHVDDNVHEVERALSLSLAAGFSLPPDDDGRLAVRLPEMKAAPDSRVPCVVVHPGASVPARTWDSDRARDLVRVLTRNGYRVAVTGSAGERALTRKVAGCHDGAVDLGGRTSFESLIALLAQADVVVTGNTGPAHLAAAVGTPVVSLFAPTVPAARWRPWMVRHIILGNQHIDCAGCRARVCPLADHPCLDVSTAEVVNAVRVLTPTAPKALVS